MDKKFFKMEYYDTYYYSNIVHNIISDAFNYLGGLEEFFGDINYKRFLEPFQKESSLHQFISFVIRVIILDDIDDDLIINLKSRKSKLPPICYAFEHYSIEYTQFPKWLDENEKDIQTINEDDIIEYIEEENEGEFIKLLEIMSEEIFYILFLNRKFLLTFNQITANYISSLDADDIEDEDMIYFSQKRKLKRVHIPKWVKRAVFYRDRGICVNCQKDLTGLINILGETHFDHIIPLAEGGINDVTNIQLLCRECNQNKSNRLIYTSNYYERWY